MSAKSEILFAGAVALPEGTPDEFMFMPGGLNSIRCGTGDRRNPKAIDVDVQCDEKSATQLQAQLESLRGNGRAFLDFNHEGKEASFWPTEFTWKSSPEPGVYVRGEWSEAGRAAVAGKMYRSFSPEFHVDSTKNKPARIVCSDKAGLNFGGLTNEPAFRKICPLWAKHAPGTGEQNTTNKNKMDKKTVALLQAQKLEAATEIETLRAKGQLDDADSTRVAVLQEQIAGFDSQLETETLRAKNAELESALLAQKTKDAEAAVASAVSRGAIPQKDDSLRAMWLKKCTDDPSNIALLASMRGIVSLPSAPRASAPLMAVTRESNDNVLRAMHAVGQRQTPDAEYGDKKIAAREFAKLYASKILPRIKEGDDISLRAANSFGTLAASITSIRTLELLTLTFPLLKSITTDFSDQIVSYGDTLTTRVVGIPTVQTYNTTTGWPTNSDMTTTDVAITYNQFKGVPISIGSHHIAGTVRRLFDEIAPAQAYALGKDIVDYVYALITSANFTGTQTNAPAATFGRTDVIALAGVMDDAKNPDMGRNLILSRPYYSAMKNDQAIITLSAFQRPEVIEQGVIGEVEGFKIIKAVNLPATALTNGTLAGFAFTRSALVLASRLSADYVNALPGASNGNLTVITTPGGFSANQVQFVNHGAATANQRLEVIYGASAGQAAAGAILGQL